MFNAAGDPNGEVKLTWHAKEVVRQIYDHTDPAVADAWVDEIIRDFADREMPLEVRRLGRTIKKWRDQIVAWHRSHVSNGPTEAINNLVKRVKRVAFGMRRFRNYRICALLYAGRPTGTYSTGSPHHEIRRAGFERTVMTRRVIAGATPPRHRGCRHPAIERTPPMPNGYAIAHLRTPQINDDVLEYIERIQGTLDPFGGHFLVHGANVEVKEGPWPGTIVVIEFPAVEQARAWYDSAAYQEILHLRTDHIDGEAIIVEGVVADYDPRKTAAALRAQAATGG